MRKLFSMMAVATLLLVLVSCGTVQTPVQTWNALDPQGKALILNEEYNEQYDSYLEVIGYALGLTTSEVKVMAKADPVGLKAMIDASDLNDEARNMLRKKKVLLQDLEDAIDIFTDIALAGDIPPQEQEKYILDLLNKLKYGMYTK
jgi:hypothetical protein